MDRTTDGAVAAALGAAHSRLEAERRARRAFHEAERRRRIVAAAGIDIDDLTEHGRRILEWLAEWDEPTTDGVVELVSATRAAAERRAPATPDRRGPVRSFADDTVANDEPGGDRP